MKKNSRHWGYRTDLCISTVYAVNKIKKGYSFFSLI